MLIFLLSTRTHEKRHTHAQTENAGALCSTETSQIEREREREGENSNEKRLCAKKQFRFKKTQSVVMLVLALCNGEISHAGSVCVRTDTVLVEQSEPRFTNRDLEGLAHE